jgi:Tol biopolymer transport system component
VVVKASGVGDLNVGPAISPDGRWIAFLSELGGLSIDLFVADATRGRIVRKLTSTVEREQRRNEPWSNVISAGAAMRTW